MTGKDRVTLSNVSGGLTRHISGPWTISFPVENISVKEIELTGDIGEWSYPTTFAISPLGAMMTGSIDVGSWGNGPFAVIYEDGTRFENVTVRHSIFTPGELCVLGNWEFTEPLDLDRAVAVEIGNWYIPSPARRRAWCGPNSGNSPPEQSGGLFVCLRELQMPDDLLELPGGGEEGGLLLGGQGDLQDGLHPVLAHNGGDAQAQVFKAVLPLQHRRDGQHG